MIEEIMQQQSNDEDHLMNYEDGNGELDLFISQ